jgi:hypothetical protein
VFTDARIQALDGYHRPILAALADGRVELDRKDASSAKAVALIRWELMRHLRAYQLFKHTRIFDPIIAGRSAYHSGIAADLKARCLELSGAFEEHVKRWSLVGSTAAWDRFTEEASAMSERIERHIAFERQKVAELLSVAGSGRR